VNEISESVTNTSANNPNSDDNFSDTSDVTDYFKEEEGTKNRLKRSQPVQAIRSKLWMITTKCSWKIV
jgi:hypothetical protein